MSNYDDYMDSINSMRPDIAECVLYNQNHQEVCKFKYITDINISYDASSGDVPQIQCTISSRYASIFDNRRKVDKADGNNRMQQIL